MSQEPDTSMELSQQDWLEMWPHLQAVMSGVEEAALRNTIGKLFAALAEFPQARESFLRVLDNPLATASNNGLRLFVMMAEKKAFERAIGRGLRLLKGGYAEWDKLDEVGNFWAWCYQGCDDVQREEIAKSLGQRLRFQDGSTWQASYVKGNLNAPALLEQLFEEIVEHSDRYASADGKDMNNYGRALLNEALLKSRRRTHFLNMLAVAHGFTQRSSLPREGLPLSDARSRGDVPSVSDVLSMGNVPPGGDVPSPDDGQSPADSLSPDHSQEEEAKRKMSLDDESDLSSEGPKIAERRDHGGADSRSLLRSKHEGDETQEVGRAGTPHPKKELDRVSRHKRCHQVVDWLRDFPHKFRASLLCRMAFKGKRSEPPEFELGDRRKHSSQSRFPGFRGGAGLNLRRPRKTGSPTALSLTTKDSLQFGPVPTATSLLHMPDELPHSTPDSTAPLQSRTNKYSPHSLLDIAPSQSPTPQDPPHSSPGSISRRKPCKTQDFVDGGDQEF